MMAIFPVGVPLLYSVLLWTNRKELNPDPRCLVAEILDTDGCEHEMYVLAKEADETRQLAESEAVCGEQMHARAKNNQETAIKEAAEERNPAPGLRRSLSSAASYAKASREIPPIWQLAFPCQASYVAALTDASSILDAQLIELARSQNPKIQHIAFLWGDYRCNCFMWEVAECSRRLMLTGMLILVAPGTISQIIVAAFVALFWVGAYGKCTPFIDEGAAASGTIAQYLTFTTLFVAVLIKSNVVAGSWTTMLTIFLISLNMAPMARLYFRGYDEYRKYRRPTVTVLDEQRRPHRQASKIYGGGQLHEQRNEVNGFTDDSLDPTLQNVTIEVTAQEDTAQEEPGAVFVTASDGAPTALPSNTDTGVFSWAACACI
jgi:hypothetical protein